MKREISLKGKNYGVPAVFKLWLLCLICLSGFRGMGQEKDLQYLKSSDGKSLRASINGTSYVLNIDCPAFTVEHVAGDVAPLSATIRYRAVKIANSSDTLCWLAQNLGASMQANAAINTNNAAYGWVWQYNRKQGWAYDFTTSTIYPEGGSFPETTVSEGSWGSSNDPCTNLLGSLWRLPTTSEWSNVVNGWSNYNDAFSSVLRLGSTYSFYSANTAPNVHDKLMYWTSREGQYVQVDSNSANLGDYSNTRNAFQVRCVREYVKK